MSNKVEQTELNKFSDRTQNTTIDTSKRVRVGIIGTGWIAGSHIKSFLKMPDVDIVAGADLVPGKAKAFFEKRGISDVKCYQSHKEMLDDDSLKLDAVSICTYNCQHAEPTIYALNKGINVLLEKPMCVTMEEAVEIMRAEKKSGKVVSIGFQPRFDANMQKIKQIVESGILGKIYYIQTGGGRRRGIPTPFGTTFIEKETGGIGALGDIGCYSLDMVLNAIGNPKPLTVSGYTSDYFGKCSDYEGYKNHPEYAKKFGVDDFAAAFIRLEGDIVVDFRISWAMNMDTMGDTIILGTKGGLKIPSTPCWNGTFNAPMKIYHEVAGLQVETEIPLISEGDNAPSLFDRKIRSFLDACKNGTPSPVPTSQIIYNQAIISGIAQSAQLGKEIEITIPKI